MSINTRTIQDFLQESSSAYSSFNQRKKRDLEIASGDFWIDSVIDEYDRKGRVCRSFNQYNKYANAITSPYSKAPYRIHIEDSDEKYREVQEEADKIENSSSFKSAVLQAVRSACLTGAGYLTLSFRDDTIVPEAVRDFCLVALDPSISSVDGSDAEQGAVVNWMSIKKAKREFGDDVCSQTGRINWSLPDAWSPPSKTIPDVCYFSRNEEGYVDFTRVVGSKIVQEETLPIRHIPLYRIGYQEVLRDGRIDYSGIVDQTLDLQIGLNIGYSTMLERANRSPKANFLMPASALDGLDEFYQKLHTRESLVCLYNGDKEPTPITETYQTQDLMNTIQTCSDLMSQVIGIPSQGISPVQNSQTATEVLIQQNNAESNVQCLYENATTAIHTLSEDILTALCWKKSLDIPEFSLVNGPSIVNERKRKRQELIAISTLLDEKSKRILAHHYIQTLDDDLKNPLLADLVANTDDIDFLSDKETSEDPQAVHIMKALQSQIEEYQKQLETAIQTSNQLKQENEQLQLEILNQKQQTLLEFQKHQDDMAIKTAELQLKAQKENAELQLKTSDQQFNQAMELEEQKREVIDSMYPSLEGRLQ